MRWLWLALELFALYVIIAAVLCLVDMGVLIAFKLVTW